MRLRDVAKVELGAQGYDQACTLDGQPVGRALGLSAPRLQRAGNGRARQGTR